MKTITNLVGGGGVLKLSLIANFLFLLLFSAIAVWKFDSLKQKIQTFSMNQKLKSQTSERVLKTFNNDIYDDFLDGEFIVNPDAKTVEFLFLGNSLTYTGVPDEEPDKTRRGLTSTKIENDYVHKLVSMYANKHEVNVKFSCVNIADFERGFRDSVFSKDKLKNIQVKNPDVVVFQIGENVSYEDISSYGELFFTRYCELIEGFKDSKRIVCIPFWPVKEKINIITDVAFSTGSRICDLSHLGSGIDPENFASSYKKYRQPGVGVHPGDIGMHRIAKNILCVLSE